MIDKSIECWEAKKSAKKVLPVRIIQMAFLAFNCCPAKRKSQKVKLEVN